MTRGDDVDGDEPIMIFGRVTRGDGSPLRGAAVTLCDLAGDQLDRTSADDGGHYQLVPPSGGTFLVICSSASRQPQATLVALSDRPLRHDVALSGGGATLGGTVAVSGSGAQGGGVVLTLTDVRGTVVAVTRSDADGTFTFADLAEGVHTLTAAAPGITPVAETVQVPAEGQIVHDLTLAGRAQLHGVVRSATAARPVPEALATLVGADGTVVGSAVTDDEGAFHFDDVADGVYTLTASGYAPVASEIEIGAGHDEDVELVLAAPSVHGGDLGSPYSPHDGGDGARPADPNGSYGYAAHEGGPGWGSYGGGTR